MEFVGDEVRLSAPANKASVQNDRALSFLRELNSSRVRPSVVCPEDAVALGGVQDDAFLQAATAMLTARFGSGIEALIPSAHAERLGAIAVSAMSVPFLVPFDRRAGGLRFRGRSVDGFGIWGLRSDAKVIEAQALCEQVVVHHHRFAFEYDPDGEFEAQGPAEEFVVELLSPQSEYRVIIGCGLPERTLAGTVELMLSRLSAGSYPTSETNRSPLGQGTTPDDRPSTHGQATEAPEGRLRAGEKLVIPVLDLDQQARFEHVRGRGIDHPRFAAHRFGDVVQRVKLELNEGGASVRTAALFTGLNLPPRSFVCDAPFLVLVVRRGSAVPFLVAWVETADWMKSSPQQNETRRGKKRPGR